MRPARCCRTSAHTPARRRNGSASCGQRASSWSRSSCSTTARPGGAARARAGPRGRRREALADRRPMLVRYFDDKQLLIADGHHRYETAVAFTRRRDSGQRADAGRPRLDPGPGARDLPHAPRLRRADAPRAARRERAALDVARRSTARRLLRASTTRGEGMLDVQLVDSSVTKGSPTRRRRRGRRGASATGEAAVRVPAAADTDRGRVRLARRGEVLPQKTTYFFPKLISGLLFHPL